MKEPTTEAGKRLLAWLDDPITTVESLDLGSETVAIEDEAADKAAATERVRERARISYHLGLLFGTRAQAGIKDDNQLIADIIGVVEGGEVKVSYGVARRDPHAVDMDHPCIVCGRVNSHDHSTEEWDAAMRRRG